MQNYKINLQRGAATFFFVLVMTIVGLTMAISAARLGLGDLEISYARERSEEARVLAEGCTENALYFIRRNPNYGLASGTIVLSFEEGSCTIEVEDLGSNRRRITSIALVKNYERTIYTLITVFDNVVTLDSWWGS